MARFAAIGFYDLSSFYASYAGKHKRGLLESENPAHKGVRYLSLMRDREESDTLKEWKQAQTFLQKVGAILGNLPKKAEVTDAYIMAFDPDGYAAWEREEVIDPDCFMRVHVLLHPAPAFRLYSNEEAFIPAPWVAFAVEHRGHVSQSNFAAPNTAHQLVLELALDVGN